MVLFYIAILYESADTFSLFRYGTGRLPGPEEISKPRSSFILSELLLGGAIITLQDRFLRISLVRYSEVRQSSRPSHFERCGG